MTRPLLLSTLAALLLSLTQTVAAAPDAETTPAVAN